ncbi:MAG TPA: thioesterase family protein [Marmoricola sp.]|nr:thioesterase family protein [Marmoricola sp.]
MPKSFFLPTDRGIESTAATSGPWRSDAQHGGPPAALLGRALESLGPGLVGRFTLDLLGPVPVAPLAVEAQVLRPGRSVSLREATLTDGSGRLVARAQGWVFPDATGGPGAVGPTLPHGPADGHEEEPPAAWGRGYLDSVEWRWISGAVTRPGPAVVWMRPRIPLLPDEEMSPLQRLLCCVDSASGASAALDPREWNFLNTELTVHVLRPPEGDWVCLDARTTLGPGSVGLATSDVHDRRGLVARSAQALLVVPVN